MPNFTPSVQRQGCRTPKLKFLLRFDQNVEYKRPAGEYPFGIFTKFAEFVPHFRSCQLLKFGWTCSRGYGVMGVLSWGVWFPQIFSAPTRETASDPQKVLEVQKHARRPLSLCQVWWASDITRRRGGQKGEFFVCLYVCLSVRQAFERQRLCARFRHEGVGVQKRFRLRWIGEGLQLCACAQLSEIDANWRHH